MEGKDGEYFLTSIQQPRTPVPPPPPLPPRTRVEAVFPQWVQAEIINNELVVGGFARVRMIGTQVMDVYEQPSQNSARKFQLKSGGRVKIMGGPTTAESFNWWQIETDKGGKGWAVGEITLKNGHGFKNLIPACPVSGERIALLHEWVPVLSHQSEYTYQDIFTISPDGTNLCNLTFNGDEANRLYRELEWSADGSQLAFVNFDGSISVIEGDGSQIRQIVTSKARKSGLDWSTDGANILYQREEKEDGIWMVSPDGGQPQSVAEAENGYFFEAHWSPDNRSIASIEVSKKYPTGGIVLLDIQSKVSRTLVDLAGHYQAKYLAWSPDGKSLVIAVEREGLYQVELASGEMRQITHTTVNDREPIWSPDGTQIAFFRDNNAVTQHRTAAYDVMLVQADGSGERKLVSTSRGHSLNWSPDGTHLIYSSEGGTMLLDARTGDVTQIGVKSDNVIDVAWGASSS